MPDAHDPSKRHAPMMLTTDLALKLDPSYGPIAKRTTMNLAMVYDAFARAWYKLTHRDMGPHKRYLGKDVPTEELIWQDPIPPVDHPLVDDRDIAALKTKILAGLSISSNSVSRRIERQRRSIATIVGDQARRLNERGRLRTSNKKAHGTSMRP